MGLELGLGPRIDNETRKTACRVPGVSRDERGASLLGDRAVWGSLTCLGPPVAPPELPKAAPLPSCPGPTRQLGRVRPGLASCFSRHKLQGPPMH